MKKKILNKKAQVLPSEITPSNNNLSTLQQPKIPPTPVRIISILYYISTGLMIILAILFFIGITLLNSILSLESSGEFKMLSPLVIVFLGILFLALAALEFFIARGLWKGKNWARITAIILMALGIIVSIILIITGIINKDYNIIIYSIINLIISATIAGYLLFSQKVKQTFT